MRWLKQSAENEGTVKALFMHNKLRFPPCWLTGDAAGVPGHRVGHVILFGGCNNHPCPCTVQEADSYYAIAAGCAGCQDFGLIAMDFHLSICQRWQVTVVKHLDFYLHLCKNKHRIQNEFIEWQLWAVTWIKQDTLWNLNIFQNIQNRKGAISALMLCSTIFP